MPKKVKEMEIIRDEEPEPVKPVSVKTELSGPKFSLGVGTPPCTLKLPPEVLEASGLKPSDLVELTACGGSIIITKIGDPRPGLPNLPPRDALTRALMAMTQEHENREREARRMQTATDEGLQDHPWGKMDGSLEEETELDSEPL
jgi:bifunctional DNA-binding transcriptional regulator/antitoxin component of YhaV-PrlF toxin-antitoxin module